jgi:iron complex outermembrane recepter protein
MNPLFSAARSTTRAAFARSPLWRLSPLSPLSTALLAALSLPTLAQTAAPTTPPAPEATATVVITGNPLGSAALAQPSTVLSGDALTLHRAGTLGETLSGQAGVTATDFGPQSSRPVIRGLDGDRIRLLDNGGASADASNLSFDHAVAVDPLVVERIEVLRGPAALQYGGNATGGVVNTQDNRIPREALQGLGGRAEWRLGGAAQERAAAALLEGGANGLNWHVDLAGRRSENLQTPRFNPVVDGQPQAATREIANSAGESRSGAVGASWADADGYLGAAVDSYRNDYGVTVEPEVTIRMKRDRLQWGGERRGLAGPFSTLSLQASHTRYQHQEVEGSGAIGTTFNSRGAELRLQATQAVVALPLGSWRGVVGLQAEGLDFSALGAEAFVPDTQTRSSALFTLQSLHLTGGSTLSAGVRREQVRVHSDGDTADAEAPRFGAAKQRDFSPTSLSLGLVSPIGATDSGWHWSATLGSTERAPAYYELYANGLHVATGVYERGDPDQPLEKSRHAELGLQWQQGAHQLRAAVYRTRFDNFIALDSSGRTVTVSNDGGGTSLLPEVVFKGVPAQLQGLEIEGRSRLLSAAWTLDATGSFDAVRGDNRASGEPLPRIAPRRLQAGLEAARGPWRGGVQLRHTAEQRRVPSTDIATPGATVLDLWASWQQPLGTSVEALWYLKLNNLGDVLAYNATTMRNARELAPAAGRALQGGVRLSF